MSKVFFDQDSVSQVRSRTDIVELVSETVKLKRTGRHYVGLCPFHEEKTGSFTVDPDKNLFYCFGCGAGGDVFSYIMKREGIEFPEALEYLARRAGIVLKKRDSKRGSGELHQIIKCLEFAHEQYRLIYQSVNGKTARQYLAQRGLSEEVIEKFQIGYAPDEWDFLVTAARKAGFDSSVLKKAGLVIERDTGGYYDRFRNRIMFPIWDVSGQVIGFGGRAIGDENPKYLNSPDTPVFHKGKELFALNLARSAIRKHGRVCVMEGYMDVVSAFQKGIDFAVAGMGTALSKDQAKILIGLADEVLLAYDQDEAGRRAAVRSIEVFREAKGRSKVAVWDGAKDPDELINKYGVDVFIKALDDAVPDILFIYSQHREQYKIAGVDGKMAIVEKIIPVLGKIESRLEQNAYIEDIARDLGLDKDSLYQDVELYKRQGLRGKKYKTPEKSNTTSYDNRSKTGDMLPEKKSWNGIKSIKGYLDKHDELNLARKRAEEGIIRSLVEKPELVNQVKDQFNEDFFRDANCRSLFSLMSMGRLDLVKDQDYFSRIAELCMRFGPVDDAERVLKDCVRKLKEIRLVELSEELAQAQRENDVNRLSAVLVDYQRLLKEVKSSKQE